MAIKISGTTVIDNSRNVNAGIVTATSFSGNDGTVYIAGNVGIGTSSPTQVLNVRKDQDAATFARIENQNNSSSAYAGVQVGAYGNTWGIAVGSNSANSNSLVFVLDPNTSISGGEKMRLDSSGRLGIGTTNPTAELHIEGTGSAAASSAPLKISVASPTLLTTPESGAFEYDRVLLYHTNDDTTNANRRALIPEIQFIRRPDSLSINDQATPGVSFFGATNRPALLGGYIYEIEAVVFISKVTNSGTLTVQASLSTGNFTFATLQTSTASLAIVVDGTTSPVIIFTSVSLTASTSHGITIKGLVQPVSNSRFDLLAFSSTATITALANSYMKVTCVGTGTTIGNFG